MFSGRVLAPALAAVMAAFLVWSMVWNYMQSPINTAPEGVEFEVAQGDSLKTVSASLATADVLAWPRLFEFWGRLTGRAGSIQAGFYTLQSGMTLAEVLALMERGKVNLYPVTILEGWTFAELQAALAGNPLIKVTLDSVTPDLSGILTDGLAENNHPEGRFFPDTYMVPRSMSDADLLRQANTLLAEKLDTIWSGRDPGLPLATPYELLILASIVEREAALDTERAQIAGVFVRRLQGGMRLQTDPSVIYGLGTGFDGNLTREHLQSDNPYNTYTRDGLPPTPIGLPGEASLYAAAHPEPGETLFFVASGKGDGSHVFSKSLREHNAAVAAYISQQRKLVAAEKAAEAERARQQKAEAPADGGHQGQKESE